MERVAGIRACLRHGVIRQKHGYVKLKFVSQDLVNAFDLMGAEVEDVVCPECIESIERYLHPPEQGTLFDDGHRGN